jgi:hypothetical protein
MSSYIVFAGGKLFYLCGDTTEAHEKFTLLKKDPSVEEVDIYKLGLSFVKKGDKWVERGNK